MTSPAGATRLPGSLAPIVDRVRAALARGAARAPEAVWAAAEAATGRERPRSLVAAVRRPAGLAVIAEMKRRSPSAGSLCPDLDPAALAARYTAAGAAALSVLTEPSAFGGRLEDLSLARAATDRPCLRKDFVVDPVQVAEARAAGADAVLLIVAVLGAAGLPACLAAADRLQMDALVEVHTAAEVAVALAAGARLLGINNRDLQTLRTDLGTTERLRPAVPPELAVVAESGIRGAADAARMRAAGADAILVGEGLLRAPDPGLACAALVAAGRAPGPAA